MKLYRNAIILVVVLGLLAGAYFFINHKKPSSSAADDTTKTYKVLEVSNDKVNQLGIENEGSNFTLKKDGKEWKIEPASEFATDSTEVDALVSSITSLSASKVVEENASDLSKYGLDKPIAIKVGMSDGTSKELDVGSANPTNEGVYVKVKDNSKVYLISTSDAETLERNRSFFAKKDILPVDAKTIKKFSYVKNGELQYAIDIPAEGKANITAPVAEEGDTTEISPMTTAVVSLAIKDVVDENPADLAKYGLDKPSFSLEYGDGKTTKTILFGKDVQKGSVVYAKYPDGKSVFTVDITPLTFLDVKLSDIVTKFVYLPNIKDVNKIDLTIDGRTIVSDITTDEKNSDNDKFKVDGKDANAKNKDGGSLFRAFYQALIGVTMDQYAPAEKPSGTPEITIKYYMKPNSKPVTVTYISKDSNYYYAMKDGVYTRRLVLKNKIDAVDGIRPTLKALEQTLK